MDFAVYTRSVNWRHRIAVVMLIVLAALPLAGTVCAMTCLSGSSAVAAHHQDGQDCESATPATPTASAPTSDESDASECAAKIGALSAYHCGTHDAALPQVAATDVKRADFAVIAAPAASDPVDPLFGSFTTSASLLQYTPPPGTAPPTATPLVLRV
jgi:hypothetical protein